MVSQGFEWAGVVRCWSWLLRFEPKPGKGGSGAGRVGEEEQLWGEEVSQPEESPPSLPAYTSGIGTRRPAQPPGPALASTQLSRPTLGFPGLLRSSSVCFKHHLVFLFCELVLPLKLHKGKLTPKPSLLPCLVGFFPLPLSSALCAGGQLPHERLSPT